MADALSDMQDQVRKVGSDISDAVSMKKQRQAVSDALGGAVSKVKSMLPHSTAPIATYTPQQKPTPTPVKASGKMPSYKSGTLHVPKTGPAKLHKGEAVLKKEDADKLRDSVSSELGGSSEKPAKHIKHIVTRKGKSGGYIHEHHHTHPEHHPMEEHVSPTQDAMMSHMMDHMGEANPGEAEADAGQSGIPSMSAGQAPGMGSPMPSGGPTAGM